MPGMPQVAFRDPNDRTNFDEVEEFFTYTMMMADWFDARGAHIPPAGMDEIAALSQTVVDNLMRTAGTKEAFLINLSALAGGRMLMPRDSLRITRLENPADMTDRNRYLCQWELRYGDIRGSYSMEETVLHSKWKKERKDGEEESRSATAGPEGDSDETERWRSICKELMETMSRRDEELAILRKKVLDCMRKSR